MPRNPSSSYIATSRVERQSERVHDGGTCSSLLTHSGDKQGRNVALEEEKDGSRNTYRRLERAECEDDGGGEHTGANTALQSFQASIEHLALLH